jgi:hydrogenase-4 component E
MATLYEGVLLDLLAVAILLLTFACLGSKLFDRYIAYYALQSVVLSAAIALVAYQVGAWDLWALALLTFLIKGIGIPITTRRYLVIRLELKRDVAISTGISTSLVIGAILTAVAYFAVGPATLPNGLIAKSPVPLSNAVILLGGLCMAVRRNTVAQLIGWLILENGVFLGAAINRFLTKPTSTQHISSFPFQRRSGSCQEAFAGIAVTTSLS